MRRSGWLAIVAGGLPAAAIIYGSQSSAVRPGQAEPAPPPAAFSNVEPEDYVGPEACRECHEDIYASWRDHPHRLMNANAGADTVVGDFSGVSVEYGGVQTVFEREGDHYFMSHRRDGKLLRRDKVTRTIGSRLQQAYVGVQVLGPEPAGATIYATERALPFVYWFSRQRWFPEHYVEQYPEPEHQPDGSLSYPTDDPYSRGARPWSEGCLLCHNTYAYAYRFNREMPGTGFEGVARPGPTPAGPPPSELVTLGVSCEACHFGGKEHVRTDGEGEIGYAPQGATLADWDPPAQPINAICAQCHTAGTLPYPNHAASLNSSEARDLLAGACASQIQCTTCHDPHVASPPGGGPDRPEHVAACTGCHEAYADEPARRAHARHEAGDASCLDCHMPRITQGIDTVVRTHRIDSPTNPSMLAAGAPNACNLCHLDKTITWTLAELREGWGKAIAPAPAWEDLYGDDLAAPVGRAWLEHPTPAARLVAATAYGRSPLGRNALPELYGILLDEYAHARMFGLFAIEAILGRRLTATEYQPTASAAEREAQVATLRSLPRPP